MSTPTTAPTITLSQPGLCVMDGDATLINEETIDELARYAGVGERVAAITARAMNGELDFKAALRERVALLKGMDSAIVQRTAEQLTFTHGAKQLIDTLHKHGWKIGVVSGGFHEVVDTLADEIGVDMVLANRLGVADNTLTGELVGEIVTKERKREQMLEWAQQLHVPTSQILALGDGANDIPMLQAAGLGIAFCAKPHVQEQVAYQINTRDLSLALTYFQH